MGKTKTRGSRGFITPQEKELTKFRHKDLQRACIIRGLPFKQIGDSVPQLQSWFLSHYLNDIDVALLDRFDTWRLEELKRAGIENEGFIRLGFVQESDEGTGEIVKRKRPRFIKKKKKKRVRNKTLGVFSGTKKELTYSSESGGKTIEETMGIVLKKFPEAKEKSIKIWYKRAKKRNLES